MMLTKNHFSKVFTVPEPPIDHDTEIATNWLLNHGHKEPSQREKAALKNITNSYGMSAVLHLYLEQMRSQILSLAFQNPSQLEKTRIYFMFPTLYLNLEEFDLNLLKRTLDSLLRTKVQKEALPQKGFLEAIHIDTYDFENLEYENGIINRIRSFAGVWDQSFMDQIDDNELSRRELSNLRTEEIFDIVIEYPRSICALQDLRQCITPAQRIQLVNAFTKACNKRLLHAGANTNDIILCYTSTIRSFLIIDPRGVLLDNASRPIRKYLKEREDTIPSIVNALLNPDEYNELSKLSEELTMTTEKPIDDLSLNWYPDPIDALPDFKKQDIIESLISIFDTKSVFVSEFAEVFAKSLLSLKTYDISAIILKLHLLKTKFGDGEFHNIDVMVRDISESKISNDKIHNSNEDIEKSLQFLILSYMYWPEVPDDEFFLPEPISHQIELYQKEFAKLKKGRKVSWVNAGVVTVELEFKDRTIELDVTPDKASVIYAFDGVSSLKLEQISKTLQMDETLTKSCLNFWINNGVIKKVEDSYVVLEEQENTQPSYDNNLTTTEKVPEKSHSIWPFIEGMLTNLGALESAKIHSFLNMAIPKEKQYSSQIHELETYLDKCVQEGKLELVGAKYRLNR